MPSERVRSRVMVRELPQAGSRPVGRLEVGEAAEWLDSVTGWHHVELPGDTRGFVSAAWTQVIETAPPLAALAPATLPAPPRPNLFRRIAHSVSRAFGGEVAIALELSQPEGGHSFLRHPDPLLPVSGFAAAGEEGLVELVLAIDASTSANEFAESDVDGDGRLEDGWAGDDSIYQAQILAARHLLAALARLPGNQDGARVRVSVVTFAGDDELFEHPPDRDFEPDTLSILAVANRDARLRVGLSSDYAEVDRVLLELSREEPKGMTNFAAAIGRALAELEGLGTMGAAAPPREGALRVVDFLTDGMPSLPYAREEAERAARYAARLAADAGIRVNVFELGHNAVTRRTSETGERMARLSGGSFVSVERPGDIVELLASTSLAYVHRVRLANRTLDERTRFIATGLDGSFYGEVPLREG